MSIRDVVSVANSKLEVGDLLLLAQLSDGFPFFAKDVVRNGGHNGWYCAAPENGVCTLQVEQNGKRIQESGCRRAEEARQTPSSRSKIVSKIGSNYKKV